MGHKKLALLALLVCAASVHASTTTIGLPYQTTQGGGPFRYGYSTVLNGTVFDASNYNPAFQPWGESWSDPAASAFLLHGHNFSGVDQTLGSSFFSKDGVEMHPGTSAEFSVLRYIAPLTGFYHIVGTFSRADTSRDGDGVAVSISLQSATIWNNGGSNIVAPVFGSSLAFNLANVFVTAGQPLDFFVGGNGSITSDLTNLTGFFSVSDTPAGVPEPSTYALGLSGLAAFFFARKRT